MKKNKHIIAVLLLLTFFPLIQGCGSGISRNIRKGINREITLAEVRANPDMFMGKSVLWGGKIISTENLKEGTVIEVIQTPLDFIDRPEEISSSRGRFLIQSSEFLDGEVYEKGKDLTVAGIIKEKKVRPIGKLEYSYIVLEPLEIKLWEPVRESRYPDRSPFYYDPFYYDPFSYGLFPPYSSPYPWYRTYPSDWHPPHGNCLYWHPPTYDDTNNC